ncbi:MAG: hypothetical protein Q9163_002043 [Psora crenata]
MAGHGHSEACLPKKLHALSGHTDEHRLAATLHRRWSMIYDIFGLFPQTLQGADLVAYADSSHQYRVFMPDFFLGKPVPLDMFPPDTDEKKKKLGEFFAGPAAPAKTAQLVPQLVKKLEATEEGKGVQKWGSLGMCWGGKIVSLTSQSGTPFSAAAEVHPAMVDRNDAKGITIPLCMLASGDENEDEVKAFNDELQVPNHIETFRDQVHGWMGARGDLKKDRVKEEYERGYKTVLEFYRKHL